MYKKKYILIICFLLLTISFKSFSQTDNAKSNASIQSLSKEIVWSDGYNLGKAGVREGTTGETTQFIQVNKDEIIQYRLITRGNWSAIAFYDKDKKFLSDINQSEWLNNRPFAKTDYNTGIVSIPDCAVYVRFCRYKTNYNGNYVLPSYLKDQFIRFYPANTNNGLISTLTSDTKKNVEDELSELTPINAGVINMVKNAYQMTHIKWTPISDVEYNDGLFNAGKDVYGIPYSSTKELFTYVPQYVSFETFMTAVYNPRSVFYTDHLDEEPYNGSNCRTFYGAVCSSLTSYACGFPYVYNSGQYENDKSLFSVVDGGYNVDSIVVGDILQSDSKGHVMLVTRVWTDNDGHRVRFEITEENGERAISNIWEREYIQNWLLNKTYIVLRYKKSESVEYVPFTDFVALDGEKPGKYDYNRLICPNRGNKSLYLEKDSVIINILSKKPVRIVVLKNGKRYLKINNVNDDIRLGFLKYGTYMIRAIPGIFKKREKATFKVINIETHFDKELNKIYFTSANSNPYIISFCYKNGGNVIPTGVQNNFISDEELEKGYKNFNFNFTDYPNLYYRIHCWDKTDNFGKIITRNISLKDSSLSPFNKSL